MAGIFLFVFLLITSQCLSADGAESLPSDEASFTDSSPARSMANNACSAPKSVVSDATLKWRMGVYNQSVFLPGEKAEFVCKGGFRQIGWLQTLTCQNDGTWTSSLSDIEDDFKASERVFGYCLTNNCSNSGMFNCTSGNQSVPICKKCDCIADCRDGSDEMECGSILINVTGRATGEIKSPTNKINYAGPLTCRRTLWTDDPGFYIKLLFTGFSMSGDCGDNYVYLANATFSDTDSPPCCKKTTAHVSCAFGGKNGAPPLSHTDKNFMIVNLVSKESNSSSFSAKWYNVNGFYPYGLIPKDDSDYPSEIKIDRSKSKTNEDDSIDPTYIAATVIFSIVAFVVLAIVGCKIGRHFFGPRCSVQHCCEWIAARRSQRSPRLSPREPSPEARPIRGNIPNEEPTQGRGQTRAVPVDAGGPSTLRTRYGSADDAVA